MFNKKSPLFFLMVQSSTGLHHYHKHRLAPANPDGDPWKRRMDHFIYVVIFLGPLMTIPQIYNIWVVRSVAGVSILSWASYLLISLVWLAYGRLHREKAIIVSNSI